jgi:hypothetical protein
MTLDNHPKSPEPTHKPTVRNMVKRLLPWIDPKKLDWRYILKAYGRIPSIRKLGEIHAPKPLPKPFTKYMRTMYACENFVPHLEKFPHVFYTIDWRFFSTNPAAIHILEQNQDKIDYIFLSQNPAIFYEERHQPPPFEKELIATVFHPDRVKKMGGMEWLECV